MANTAATNSTEWHK